ncbi:hypothetical protein HI914_01007 [Erysiphe necator]|nr:hypothetical protein HI914_01007 [Erysiphe necator]
MTHQNHPMLNGKLSTHFHLALLISNGFKQSNLRLQIQSKRLEVILSKRLGSLYQQRLRILYNWTTSLT